MGTRYEGRETAINSTRLYKNVFKKRDVRFIRHYSTPEFQMPTEADEAELDLINHIWKVGDRFYKLANEYYNDPELWWVIALFNRTPTESHVKLGDSVQIPIPLEKILLHFGM